VLLEKILFFIAAAGVLAGAFGVVTLRNPFFSVLGLVVHLVSLAALFLLLQAQFIAAAQIVVYAGAVMVLYVFVVAYIGGVDEPFAMDGVVGQLGPVFAGALLVELCFAILGTGLSAIDTHGAHLGADFGSPGQVGQLLLQRFLIPFEAASFLLLVAAVGAVVLARRRRGLADADDELPEEGPPTRPGWIREPDVSDPVGRAGGASRPAVGTAEGPGDPAPHGGRP
jgi:NADH-quinone oxidoreductase subunit J